MNGGRGRYLRLSERDGGREGGIDVPALLSFLVFEVTDNS